MLKAVLVDLDGTLADTVKPLYKLYCDLLSPHGVQGTPEEFKTLNGKSLKEIVAILKARYPIPSSEEALKAEYDAGVVRVYQQIPLFPFVAETLTMVKKAKLQLVLVTSAHLQLARLFLDNHGLSGDFDAIQTSEGLPGKPSPAIYENALKKAQTTADHAVAIEDSDNGFEAAMQAGIYTLRLRNDIQGNTEQDGFADVQDWRAIHHILTKRYGLSDV
ncbi:MAG: HAD family phosphatase [Parachlamydia sp.]|nr:HAD family phosphatase [Parachlamydia sp.]